MAASTALQVLVSPFLGVVFENLGSLIQKEIGLVLGVNKELVKLSNTLSTIRDVIDDAEVKQIDDKPIYNWLRRLKDLAYEADDILDECATEALIPAGSDVVNTSSCNIQVTSPSDSSCFDFKGFMFRRSIGKRIKELRKKFDELADQRIKFHLNLIPGNVESRKEKRETSSFLTEPKVYGREEEKEHIANLLLKGGEAREDVLVCCLIGMGGLGKTTLAQMVYNDEKIANHFQLRCWVCVSEDFVLKTLLKSIIESTGGNGRDLEDLDPLQRRVQEILSGKKFLLMLDDVWNEDQTKWYKLKSMLTCGGIGSSIIVTTRLESVASITSTLPICRLEILSEEDCWSLFKHYAFDMEDEKYHSMFEEIGKQITKKCAGVPLAAKALGGLLRFKKTENEWLFVRDSALWDLPQDKEDAILPALRLSYNHLPSHLRECFSYCSIFPKDYIMVKEELIHLWMANGFFQPKGNMGLEDIGNEIFNELLWRSFFQDAENDEYGDIRCCKMHDLVHDLACSINVNECKVVEVNKDENAFKGITRHLSLQLGESYSSTNISNSFLSQSQPLLRTFLLQAASSKSDQLIQGLTYSNVKCLRVLDLHQLKIKTLHVSIGNLKHLRYLDLSYSQHMRSLPDESICNLRNLQVLKLDYCHNLQVLPENMRKLTNLRHLGIEGCNKLTRMPVGMGNLSCLRTLNMFVVVPEVGRGITELYGLDHLTGELKIKGLEHVRNSKDAKNANLMKKKNLSVLSLFWSENNNGTIEEEEEEVVASIGEGLQPHPNIKMLNLQCYDGLKFSSWLSHSCLPNLVNISLVGCRRCKHLPSLGQLPFLETLMVSRLDSVKCIGDEFYGDHHPQGLFFATLKQLEIRNMPNLEEWYASSSQVEENIRLRRRGVGELPVFPSLKSLTLENCPKLRTMPTTLSSSLKDLKLWRCNEMISESRNTSVLFSLVKGVGCLQSLNISSCNKIESLPKVLIENLPSTLTELRIRYCRELVYLPEEMQNLTSLKTFRIDGCSSLKYLPELGSRNNTALIRLGIYNCDGLTSVSHCLRHLTTLEYLLINGSPKLEFLQDDFQDLTSLGHLQISYLPQMTCLPEGLQQVAGTLESLSISGWSGLTSLPEWMYKFTSLRRLFISRCENLKVLPEEVLNLTALKTVNIEDCHSDMHRRYTKETGEDWHKIAHIPDLNITERTWSQSSSRHGDGRMKCINNSNSNSILSCFSSSSSHGTS